MDIVYLPNWTEYWSKDPYMPQCPIAYELGMTHDQFFFLWIIFHIYNTEENKVIAEQEEVDNKDGLKRNDSPQEYSLEFMQKY
eukprot:10885912-Ditylum_brightwellii.AAC.1